MNPPTGLAALVAFRTAGKLPARQVSLSIGDDWKAPDWFSYPGFLTFPEGVIRTGDRLDDLDLRVFYGLDVFVHAARYDDRVAEIFDRLQQYARYILLVILDWPIEDFGIEWRKP